MRGFIEAFRACDIERFLDTAIALTGSDPHRIVQTRSLVVDPDQARMPVGQKSVGGCRGSRVGAAHRRSSQRTFGSLDRRAHQTMG